MAPPKKTQTPPSTQTPKPPPPDRDSGSAPESDSPSRSAKAKPPPSTHPPSSSSVEEHRDSGTASESDSPLQNPLQRNTVLDTTRKSKTPFVRVWTQDDEIALLRGLIEFHEHHGHEPTSGSDLAALLEAVRDDLRSEFSTAQLASKIRHTKRKYLHDSASERIGRKRSCKRGALDSAHKEAVYELSNKVWGDCAKKAETEPGTLAVANNATPVDDHPPILHEDKKDDGGDPKWARDLILKEFGEDSGSCHMLGSLEKALGAMNPDVVLAFGQRLKELGRDRYKLWRRQMQLRIDIVGIADETLASVGQAPGL